MESKKQTMPRSFEEVLLPLDAGVLREVLNQPEQGNTTAAEAAASRPHAA